LSLEKQRRDCKGVLQAGTHQGLSSGSQPSSSRRQ